MMEKNSVVQEGKAGKTSGKEDVCPLCGSTVEYRGQVKACPKHGTSPWEASTAGKK